MRAHMRACVLANRVKRAINCQTHEQVALKIMHKLDPDESSTRRRYNRLEKEVSPENTPKF